MTPLLQRLMNNLQSMGITVVAGNEPGQLLLRGPASAKTPAVLDAVKAFKPDLLKLLNVPTHKEPPRHGPDSRPARTGLPDAGETAGVRTDQQPGNDPPVPDTGTVGRREPEPGPGDLPQPDAPAITATDRDPPAERLRLPPVSDSPAIGTLCPKCRKLTDERRRCWACHDRACEGCNGSTGSAFIAYCWMCGLSIVEQTTTEEDQT